MTQAPPDRLDRIETAVEKMSDTIISLDKKLDIFIATTDERFKAIDQRFDAVDQRLESLEERFKSQDNRIWGLIAGVVLALFGLLAKMAFFPGGQL